MYKCQVCRNPDVKVLLDFGLQALCNRCKYSPQDKEYRHPLILGDCQTCGLIQLTNPVPPEEIIPKVNWLKYNEPEDHLDALAESLSNLPGLPKKPAVCGITYKDESLLRRLSDNLFDKTWCIDPKDDLNIEQSGVAGETIIPKLTPSVINRLAEKNGPVDLIVARHVLEHAPDTKLFLNSIINILNPGGYILFEVPDCSSQLTTFDYSMLWEEHILYFVPSTLANAFVRTSLEIVWSNSYPYAVENALTVVVKITNKQVKLKTNPRLNLELKIGQSYSDSFLSVKDSLNKLLRETKPEIGRIAVFGAGHLSTMFINIMQIDDLIEFVVDDDVNKQATYIPGSNLSVKPSSYLIEDNIKLCLLTQSPESELNVLNNNQDYVNSGGVFSSIFPGRDNSFLANT